jgi:hypothetical protein
MRGPLRSVGAWLALLALLTLGELRLYERVLYEGHDAAAFVTTNVKGILAGRPVWQAWQHRLVAPLVVAGLARVTGDLDSALRLHGRAMVLAANLLLFALLRRRGEARALQAVALFGLAHALLLYRLEYPWDGVDVLVFAGFGAWAAGQGQLMPLWPLLLVATFNHETALYLPLWYLLAPLDAELPALRRRRDTLAGALAAAIMAGLILVVRALLYAGRPDLPGQTFEPATPVIGNSFHLVHNLGQLFAANWTSGRAFISLAFLSAVVVLSTRLAQPARRRAALWSLMVLLTIVCFGYVNETRLYLPLCAFWFTYGDRT